jgi:serine/threonine-protein kinase
LGPERFLREIKIAARLDHPHILALFDSGNVDGFLCYVMPYVEGETSRTKLDRETQFGIDEAARITRDVADARVPRDCCVITSSKTLREPFAERSM